MSLRPHLPTILLAALGLALGVPQARAAESYDSCTGFITSVPATITTQGVWCLDRDLSTALDTGPAITIAANNVTLDCNDFKLGGLAAGTGTLVPGVYSDGRQNSTVRNCNIRGFFVGALLVGDGHQVEDSRFDSNRGFGIFVQSVTGMVRRNQVLRTGGSSIGSNPVGISGIGAVDMLDNTVDTVTAVPGSGAVATGLDVAGDGARLIANNRVRNILSDSIPFSAAIAVGFSTTGGVSVRDNTLANPAGDSGNVTGISCFSANTVIVSGNHLHEFTESIGSNCHDGGGNVVLGGP